MIKQHLSTTIVLYTSILFLLTGISACSTRYPRYTDRYFQATESVDGYWGSWNTYSGLTINFYTNHFVIYASTAHPSQYLIRVSYNLNTEKKRNGWYEYEGAIEYFIAEQKHFHVSESFPFQKWPTKLQSNNGLKKTSEATVRMQVRAEKTHNGGSINVFFENNAIAISGTY